MAWKIRFYSGLNQGAEVTHPEPPVSLCTETDMAYQIFSA